MQPGACVYSKLIVIGGFVMNAWGLPPTFLAKPFQAQRYC